MAFGGSFKEDHPYATGLLLLVVAGFGIAGSITGQLAAMLAALWVPDALEQNQAGTGSNPTPPGQGSGPNNQSIINPNYNPKTGKVNSTTDVGGPPPNQANVGSQFTGSVAAA